MRHHLHKIYYLLAIIDVATIIITLFLAYRIYLTYDESFQVSQQWMQRSMQYDRLTDLAIEANAPGNNVFESRNVPKEQKSFHVINREIERLTHVLMTDARQNLAGYPLITNRLKNFSQFLAKANQLTKKIFVLVRNNELTQASSIMATMDGQFHLALLEISQLRAKVRDIQKAQLFRYHSQAQAIFYKEFYIAGFIFLLIILIIFFAHRVKASFETMLNELDKKNSKIADSENKLKSVLNTITEAVILIDSKGVIQYVNSAARSMFQYTISELKNKNIKMLMPEPNRSKHDAYLERYEKLRHSRVLGNIRDISGLRKDGGEFPLEISVNGLEFNDRRMYVGVLRDVTEKKKSEFYLKNIANIQEMYINGADKGKLFEVILTFLLAYTQSEYGFIGAVYYDENNDPYLKTYAITNVAWDETTHQFYEENALEGLEFRNLNTLFGYTMKTGKVVIANDPISDPRSGGLPKGHPGMDNYLGVPIVGKDGMIAMYGMANRMGGYNECVVQELTTITNVMTSIIESTRSLSLIERMANRDALTGAYNRFYFKSYVKDLLHKRERKNASQKFCIMMVDFNKFKHINDYYGHEYGDYILKEFVSRAQNKIKPQDTLARIGGDEFVILVDGLADFSDAGKVAERIVALSKQPYKMNQLQLSCTASIGIACFPVSGQSVDELLRHADLALYRAKKIKAGYAYFSNKLQEKFLAKKNLERDIVLAFERREFKLKFQPKVHLQNLRVVGCEALIRWQHPQRGEVPPIEFIEVIESMGLAERLNIYVAEAIVESFEGFECKGPLSIAINLSPSVHKLEKNFQRVVSILDRASLPQSLSFDFELTETSFMSEQVNFKKGSVLDKLLTKHGIGLALDDFGIEYSSINRLFECNFSSIKIDKSFIQKIDSAESQSAQTIIEAIIHIADGLGVGVIAEGVETQSQSDILQSLGCYTVQGFYFYRSMPVSDLAKLL